MLAKDVKPGTILYIVFKGMMGILEVDHIIEFKSHRRFILIWVINPWRKETVFGFLDFNYDEQVHNDIGYNKSLSSKDVEFTLITADEKEAVNRLKIQQT